MILCCGRPVVVWYSPASALGQITERCWYVFVLTAAFARRNAAKLDTLGIAGQTFASIKRSCLAD